MNSELVAHGDAKRRVDEWREKLVDLSRRNRLLYFKPPTSKSRNLVQLREPDAQSVVDEILTSGKWRFWYPRDLGSRRGDDDGEVTLDIDDIVEDVRGHDELATGAPSVKDLHRTLENLYRRSTTDYQERGLRILHLAVGLLHWTDPDSKERVESPLILIPVELEREGIGKPFYLRLSDEDPVVNPTLSVKLMRDFGVEVPEIEGTLEADEGDDYDLTTFFDEVAGLVDGFHIEPTCFLGLFTFHKEVLYRDLSDNWETAIEAELVGALARGESVTDDGSGVPGERDLDRVQPPATTVTVVDADSSQRMCLELARAGKSFVIQGPPGTGKSQTIANLIAQSIADGKSVLFVSEKMAALEVVFNRLRVAGLDDFCLELHSHKVNKREVARALGDALTARVRQRRKLSSTELARLEALRDQLNDYVDALHLQRDPLGQTAYTALGRLTLLNGAPDLHGPEVNATIATAAHLNALIGLSGALERRWEIAEQGDEFVWRGLAAREWTARDGVQLDAELTALWEAYARLRALADEFAEAVTLGKATRSDAVERFVKLAPLLLEPRPVQPGWLMSDDLAALVQRVDAWSARATEHSDAVAALSHYGSEPAAAEIDEFARRHDWLVGFAPNHEAALSSPGVLGAARSIEEAARTALQYLETLHAALGTSADQAGLEEAAKVIAAARIVTARIRPAAGWFPATRLNEAKAFITTHRPTFERQNVLTLQLDSRYHDGFAETAAALAPRYKVDEQRFLAGVRGQHRQDKKTLRQLTRSGQLPESLMADLDLAVETVDTRKKLAAIDAKAQSILGAFYGGLETDFAAIDAAIADAETLIDVCASGDIGALSRSLSTEPDLAFHAAIDKADTALTVVRAGLSAHAELFSRAGDGLTGIAEWMAELASEGPAFAAARGAFAAHRAEPTNTADLLREGDQWRAVAALRHEFQDAASELRTRFPHWRVDESGDWSAIASAVAWAQTVRKAIGALGLSTAEHIASPAFVAQPAEPFLRAWEEWTNIRDAFLARFDVKHRESWQEILDGPWEAALDVIEDATEHFEEVEPWVDYAQAFDKLDEIGWGQCARQLEAGKTPRELVRPAFERAFLAGWIESVSRGDERLKEFRGQDHEALIKEFVDLDLKLIEHSRERVVEACNARRPATAGLPDSQVAIVRSEAGKQRRHWPVRKLVARIQELLPSLKPCLMMSPLSVSQFLPPTMRFDLVIFDEASQVTVEDSICALYRANQHVIAGDPKQLPPTSFFRTVEDEDDDEDDEDAAASWESILDRADSAGLRFQPLTWHYRSRHESLIAFSNNAFYGDKLVTFPSSWDDHPGLGVQFEFVANGVYDRGGSRTNKVEAARVAEIVFEQFQRFPGKSVGVVTFSNSQMTAVQDEIDNYRMKNRQFERLFAEDRLDGFFVKNLENVQGDERDIMIFSVGYGRDKAGHFSTNFGPLNKEKGERRLNVAITRAREKIVVVSSIRATDFPMGADLKPGVHHFRNYLDFAERGAEAVLGEFKSIGGEYDSDFEEAVASALRELGYQVKSQVGVGSLRIDLGVVDPEEPGKFLAGVECDGAQYHSTVTARDRDRLRQHVLEEHLGWRIVRVWSPDWFYRRPYALAKLERELKAARSKKAAPVATAREHIPREIDRIEITDASSWPGLEARRRGDALAAQHDLESRHLAALRRVRPVDREPGSP